MEKNLMANTDIAVPETETAQLMQAIIRAAADPGISPDKMSALFDLHERMRDRAAKLEFAAALSRAQANFKTVDRKGKIVVYSKRDRDNPAGVPAGARPQQVTPYALWEDVAEAIMPPLTAEGFSLSFESEIVPPGAVEGKIVVHGILSHRDGASKRASTPPMQHDSTGSKNSVQAVMSTISYGKRMVAGLLVNFVSRGEDNDGADGAPVETISEEQYNALNNEIIAQGGSTLPRILEAFSIEALQDLPSRRYEECVQRLNERRKRVRI